MTQNNIKRAAGAGVLALWALSVFFCKKLEVHADSAVVIQHQHSGSSEDGSGCYNKLVTEEGECGSYNLDRWFYEGSYTYCCKDCGYMTQYPYDISGFRCDNKRIKKYYVLGCGKTDAKAITLSCSKSTDGWTQGLDLNASYTIHDADVQVTGYLWNGWAGGSSYHVTSNGTYTLQLTGNGNADFSRSVSVTVDHIDRTAPVIESFGASSNQWGSSLKLSVAASDGESGLAAQAYSFDGGTSWSSTNTYTVTANGDYAVSVRDAAGNISTARTTVSQIDTKPPRISVSTSLPAGQWGSSLKLSVAASDGESGLAAQAYSFDGGTSWSSTNTYTVTANGDYAVSVRDAAGNISTARTTVSQIDTKPPHISVSTSLSPGQWGSSLELSVAASDGESGLAAQAYSFDGGTSWSSKNTYTVTANGDYAVSVRDAAGNISTARTTVTQIDTKPPRISVSTSLSPGQWGSSLKLSVAASDGESGLAAQAYSFDGGTSWSSTNTYTVTANGDYAVSVRDAAGNISTARTTVSQIDTKPPRISVSTSPSLNQWYDGELTVVVRAEDAESGLADAPYSFDGGATYLVGNSYTFSGSTVLEIAVVDRAGNVRRYSAHVEKKVRPRPAPTPDADTESGGSQTGSGAGGNSGAGTGTGSAGTGGSSGAGTGAGSAGNGGSSGAGTGAGSAGTGGNSGAGTGAGSAGAGGSSGAGTGAGSAGTGGSSGAGTGAGSAGTSGSSGAGTGAGSAGTSGSSGAGTGAGSSGTGGSSGAGAGAGSAGAGGSGGAGTGADSAGTGGNSGAESGAGSNGAGGSSGAGAGAGSAGAGGSGGAGTGADSAGTGGNSGAESGAGSNRAGGSNGAETGSAGIGGSETGSGSTGRGGAATPGGSGQTGGADMGLGGQAESRAQEDSGDGKTTSPGAGKTNPWKRDSDLTWREIMPVQGEDGQNLQGQTEGMISEEEAAVQNEFFAAQNELEAETLEQERIPVPGRDVTGMEWITKIGLFAVCGAMMLAALSAGWVWLFGVRVYTRDAKGRYRIAGITRVMIKGNDKQKVVPLTKQIIRNSVTNELCLRFAGPVLSRYAGESLVLVYKTMRREFTAQREVRIRMHA